MKTLPVFMLLFIGACTGNSQTSNAGSGTTEDISAMEFRQHIQAMENEQILDVRTPAEWAEGIIPGAQKINFYDTDFEQQLSNLDKNKPVLIYCASGGRSGEAMDKMEKMGFVEVYNLRGGMNAWRSAGHEVVK